MDKRLVIHNKKFKGETSVISARMPNELIRTLDHIAAESGRTRNEILQACLEFAIENLVVED